MMVVSIDALCPQAIVGEYFGNVQRCVDLLQSTRGVLSGGAVTKYFSGKKSKGSRLRVFCNAWTLQRWVSFVECEGYRLSRRMSTIMVSRRLCTYVQVLTSIDLSAGYFFCRSCPKRFFEIVSVGAGSPYVDEFYDV
jgi:hypothetical protein